jgi:hypothetical protein
MSLLFVSHPAGRNSMKNKHPEDLPPLPDSDLARTSRHLRFMKALFKIDDPAIELALVAVVERLAATSRLSGDMAPPVSNLTARRRQETQD